MISQKEKRDLCGISQAMMIQHPCFQYKDTTQPAQLQSLALIMKIWIKYYCFNTVPTANNKVADQNAWMCMHHCCLKTIKQVFAWITLAKTLHFSMSDVNEGPTQSRPKRTMFFIFKYFVAKKFIEMQHIYFL